MSSRRRLDFPQGSKAKISRRNDGQDCDCESSDSDESPQDSLDTDPDLVPLRRKHITPRRNEVLRRVSAIDKAGTSDSIDVMMDEILSPQPDAAQPSTSRGTERSSEDSEGKERTSVSYFPCIKGGFWDLFSQIEISSQAPTGIEIPYLT